MKTVRPYVARNETSTVPRDHGLVDVFRLLAKPERRRTIAYLADGAPEEVSVEAIARHVCEESSAADGDRAAFERTVVDLHHRHLPELEEYGVVEFDPDAGRVRYRSDDLVESLLEIADAATKRTEA